MHRSSLVTIQTALIRCSIAFAVTSAVVGTVGATPAVAKTTHEAQPKACVKVVRACQKAGFLPGKANKHPGQGLLSNCVRPIAKGHAVKGVVGVSKSAAQACLTARRRLRTGKG